MPFFSVPTKKLSVDPAIVGKPDLFIAETAEDAAAAIATGFPALAFTNIMRTDDNYLILIDNCKKPKRTYLLDSSGDTKRLSEIGFRLASKWLPVFVVSVYDKAAARHVSLVDYLKTNSTEDFKALVKQAKSFTEILIGQLPTNFMQASPALREHVIPILNKADDAARQYFIDMIAKHVKAKVTVITKMLKDSMAKQAEIAKQEAAKQAEKPEEVDPEIKAAAMELLLDPQVFRKRIDTINRSGVVGERTNISLYFVTLDSRLSKDFGKPGQRALALKTAGHFGAGKSFSLSSCLTIYPPNAYHLLTSGSEKSLYYLPDGLSHKCLIVAEGFQFTGERGDNEISFIVRCLISEGQVVRIVVEKGEDGKQITRRIEIPGPTSFITTTVLETLEPQLEDRLLSSHPSESADQTRRIIESLAEQSENNNSRLSEHEIKMWQTLHVMLEPVSVSIPFASKISDHIKHIPNLHITMRRGFGKLLNVVRAIAILHQYQRQRDVNGNVIAEIADYALGWQIIQDSFKENMRGASKTTDQRLQYLQSVGHVSLKDLALREGVSRAAFSSWMKRVEGEGDAKWVDSNGNDFQNDIAMKAAKRAGRAHIAVTGQWHQSGIIALPTPSELVNGALEWQPGGLMYERFNLDLVPDLPSAACPPPVPVTTAAATSPIPAKSAPSFFPFGKKPVTAVATPAPALSGGLTETEPFGFIEPDQQQVLDEEDLFFLEASKPGYRNPLI